VLQKNLGFLATGKIGVYPSVRAPLQFLHESIFRNSPSFTAIAEKKGWIVSKANKTGQFSIITTTPRVIPAQAGIQFAKANLRNYAK